MDDASTPPCLYCERGPAATELGLCRACHARAAVLVLYSRRAGWTPEWEAHLRRLTRRARAGLPLFGPGGRAEPCPARPYRPEGAVGRRASPYRYAGELPACLADAPGAREVLGRVLGGALTHKAAAALLGCSAGAISLWVARPRRRARPGGTRRAPTPPPR